MNSHPRGKLCENDEGGTLVAVRSTGNTVILDFLGNEISWFGMDIETAEELVNLIMKKVQTLKKLIKEGKISASKEHVE